MSDTKIHKKPKRDGVQTHKKRIEAFKKFYNLNEEEAISAIDLMDEYLPGKYTEAIMAMAIKQKVQISLDTIRAVKIGRIKNNTIFSYFIEFASEKKAQMDHSRMLLQKSMSNESA